MLYRWFKRIAVFATIVVVTVFVIGYLLLSSEPLVSGKTNLLPADVKVAEENLKRLQETLVSPDKNVSVSLYQRDLDSFFSYRFSYNSVCRDTNQSQSFRIVICYYN